MAVAASKHGLNVCKDLCGLDNVRINLPSVGENLQDQLKVSIVVSTNTPVTGAKAVALASASDIFGSSLASVAASILSQLPTTLAPQLP